MMDSNGLSLRKSATVQGISQPFLSRIRAGKRPIPEALRTKVEALGAYHLLIGDKHLDTTPADERGGHTSNNEPMTVNFNGGDDWVRTSGLALMKRPLCR